MTDIKQCDNPPCRRQETAYQTPAKWQVAPLYKRKKGGKSVFVGMAHLCKECVSKGYSLSPSGEVRAPELPETLFRG